MKRFTMMAAAVVVLGLSVEVRAGTVVFSDNFNSENGGVGFLNYGTPNQNGQGGSGSINTSFANWTVTGGSVDLLPIPPNNGPFPGPYTLLPTSDGLYIDLDGTTGQNGTLTSKNISLGIGSYQFFFDMAGSQRGEAETALVSVKTGLGSTNISVAANAPLSTYEIDFTLAAPQTVQFQFQDTTSPGNDDVGPLLDNIVLDEVTAPDGGSTVILLGAGMITLGFLRRKLPR